MIEFDRHALPYQFVRFSLDPGRRVSLALALALGMTGCAHLPQGSPAAADRDAKASRQLKAHLVALAPTVTEEEAQRAADCARHYSEQLAREYRAVRPALLHNFLVNVGIKNRGLCYHWAEDLLARLETLNLTTLELHWGVARAGTVREHNSVVVTARGQPFEHGIVLDAWRRSGRLVWKEVSTDKYPWVESIAVEDCQEF